MSDHHDAYKRTPYEGTDALADALGATCALFQQLREQVPDTPEHILAFLVLTLCATKTRKSLGPTVFRKRWYQMSITARTFAEVLAEPPPDDATDVIKDMLTIYHHRLDTQLRQVSQWSRAKQTFISAMRDTVLQKTARQAAKR